MTQEVNGCHSSFKLQGTVHGTFILQASAVDGLPLLVPSEHESEQEQALGALDGSLQPALSTWETFQPSH